jgi:hypothetical protein
LRLAYRGVVAPGVVGIVDLVTEKGGAVRGVAEGGEHAAQGVGEEETGSQGRGRTGEFADETASQAVVVGVVLQGAAGGNAPVMEGITTAS